MLPACVYKVEGRADLVEPEPFVVGCIRRGPYARYTAILAEDLACVSVCASLSICARFACAVSCTLVLLHNHHEHAELFIYRGQ